MKFKLLTVLFFISLSAVYGIERNNIIIELTYPSSDKSIKSALNLISNKKAKGVFFKGNWLANDIYRINHEIKQITQTDYEVWSNVPSVSHKLFNTPIEFPNEDNLSRIGDSILLNQLFKETSKYLNLIGINKVIWQHNNQESGLISHFQNQSIDFITQKIYSNENSISTLSKNSSSLSPLKSDWKEWLEKAENISSTIIIPLATLLNEEPKKERLNLGHDIIVSNHQYTYPQVPNELIESMLSAYRKSIVIVKNDNQLLPIKELAQRNFQAIYFGTKNEAYTIDMFNKYVDVNHYIHEKGNPISKVDEILRELKNKNDILIVTLDASLLSLNDVEKLVEKFSVWKQKSESKLVIQVLGASTQKIEKLESVSDVLLTTNQSNAWLAALLPQITFGGASTVNKNSNKGRFGFTLPEQVGLSSQKLAEIDSIAMLAINEDATPGCQVLVAKDGKVVFYKSYGHHSYSKQEEVTQNSLYDIASITKVLATLPTLMYLDENNKISTDKTLADYLPDASSSNKGSMKIKDILTHQAGLMSFIPHWYQLMEDSDFDTTMVAFEQSEEFPIEVVPGLYAVHDIEEKVWNWTIDSRLTIRSKRRGMHRYFYSDLGFYIFHRLIEKTNQKPLEDFTDEYFYRPLGLKTMTYLPLEKFDRSRIAPTEMDVYFRKSLVHGTVHDPGAAMKGGVSGHAGLFSNALDVGIMMQMFLQNGWYGNEKYLEGSTVKKFNTQPYAYNKNRRALGWDKPHLEGDGGATSKYCSKSTFGHTGFTGTSTWADPENNIVYVFLSNRIHPFAGNRKLIRENYRKKIHNIIYESIIDSKQQ